MPLCLICPISLWIFRLTFSLFALNHPKEECKKCEKLKQKLPEPPNRVEFVPIEWYSKVRSPNHSLMTSLNAVTLRSIPALRSIANDVVFDVLMYLTPEFCGGKRAVNVTMCWSFMWFLLASHCTHVSNLLFPSLNTISHP